MGGVLIFTSPFWCEPFRYQRNEYLALRKQAADNIAESTKNIAHIRATYDKGLISDEWYIANLNNELDILEALQRQNELRMDRFRSSLKILDWDNTFVFLLALGTRIPALLFPLLLIYLFKSGIIQLREDRLRASFYSFIAATLSIGLFWMAWVFWPFPDLPFNAYLVVITGSSLLLATAITHFSIWREGRMERLRKVIGHLNVMIRTNIPERLQKKPETSYEDVVWDAFKYQDESMPTGEGEEGEQ